CRRFYGRVKGEQVALVTGTREGIGGLVVPDICPVAAVLPEPNIITMRAGARLEDQHQLVLTAIERTQTAVVLDPYAEIYKIAVRLASSCEQLVQVPPIHANVVKRTCRAVFGQQRASVGQEPRELLLAHFA